MKGKITVVSTGPGDLNYIIPAALKAIEECDTVVGYATYLDLINELIKDKKIIRNGMKQEAERCKAAVEAAKSGSIVTVISGGDAGVYGLAGLVLELLNVSEREQVFIIPGVTSATACAAILGAPLIHDFAVISLSNLMTEDSLIEKRLKMAAEGDFVTVLYNPKSKKRIDLFYKIAEMFLKYRNSNTPVGIVRDAYREEQCAKIITLGELAEQHQVDMKTTIIIGNSQTFSTGSRMITPRGYKVDRK